MYLRRDAEILEFVLQNLYYSVVAIVNFKQGRKTYVNLIFQQHGLRILRVTIKPVTYVFAWHMHVPTSLSRWVCIS